MTANRQAARPGVAFPKSLWAAVTAGGPTYRTLDGEAEADVVVVGGGLSGLAAALHLAETGHSVAVIEAAEPGWGAAGRNNGQVIPTLPFHDPDDIIAREGEAGERFVGLLRNSAQHLFNTVSRLGIVAEAQQTGWLQPAHSDGRMRQVESRVEQWAKRGAPVSLLTSEQVRQLTGSDAWFGGWENRSGGHVNPLALTRGLAQAVTVARGRIYANSPAYGIRRDEDRWVVDTKDGRLTARALILATNAYTGEFASLMGTPATHIRREILPVLSWQIATEPMPASVQQAVLPRRHALTDTHLDPHFMRWDARGRLVTGGALANPLSGAWNLKTHITRRLQRLYPGVFDDVRFDYVWNGRIAVTPDHFPRFHKLGPDAVGWTGCNGRGVALALSVGRELARSVTGTPDQDIALPFGPPTVVPYQSLAKAATPLAVAFLRWQDSREVA
ncbi:NAD(P)/FAD-dependent oxidoreductase [Blastochloris sulfoviridis]|uniref:FAD-binding oxidoreductase n=1 Tax=Blastochloris sulfoviridis TaxID=50712 RepID=A0A5M6I415_9HYPH|nr:FAD-binding oxidoreductase [Blastochloris sulfoviridis]KAA5602956.1 FAD-binding oxidoreductase [Blastochloris sulfoviridis]